MGKKTAVEASEETLRDDAEVKEPVEEEDEKPAAKAKAPAEEPTLVRTEKRFRLFRKTELKEDWFILNDRNQLLASGEKMLEGEQLVKRMASRH